MSSANGPASEQETADDPSAVTARTLVSIPGVESVQPISDTRFAIEATSLAGLQQLGLPISDQTSMP